MPGSIEIGIIGAGPAGLTLALLLNKLGVKSRIFESKNKEYVEHRVRAGLLEHNTVEVFDYLQVSDRLHKEGLAHDGCTIRFNGINQRLDFVNLTGNRVTIYGQQEVVKDLIKACGERGVPIQFESTITDIKHLDSDRPIISTENEEYEFDFVLACDGFHGIGRKKLPIHVYNQYKIEYPYSWLGILANASPVYHELIYAFHPNGFSLASMRSEKISRLYLQVPDNDLVENWSDNKIWDELDTRLGLKLNRGEIFEKTITPMRSFMIDHLQYGRLFLAGDAAHIVPPTGAKGLNLAVADVWVLSNAIKHYLETSDISWLNDYSSTCLKRIWRVQDFSNFMTMLCHKTNETNSFEEKLQQSKFDYLRISEAYQKTIAENYVGLPLNIFE